MMLFFLAALVQILAYTGARLSQEWSKLAQEQ